jgi:hypothetical protein
MTAAPDPRAPDETPEESLTAGVTATSEGEATLPSLSVAGLTRRRVAGIAAAAIAVWVVIVFGRQVGEASAAAAHAEQLAAENEVISADIAALRRELDMVASPGFVSLEARAERLGRGRERAFTLAPDAPALTQLSPGSANVALGAEAKHRPPVEVWMSLLFGPAD